ncbi:MAG: hypothetical protein LAO56_02795 [Acidobacteriia bacterium]|nr:hypothetical protein [Terriglobia bacterium]
MPVTYTIDRKEKVIRTQCVGMVTFPEVADHFQQLERDPDCAERLAVLLDLSEVRSTPDTGQIRAVSYELRKIQGKVRFDVCAVVASRDVLFGMLRVFEVMAEPYFRSICVFRGIAEAEAWLVSQRQQSAKDAPIP